MKNTVISILLFLSALSAAARSGFDLHKADFYAVLGFEENAKVTAWMRQISSSMIDNYRGPELPEYGGENFYNWLKSEFPGFKCKHRLLFHWGYNSRPWSDELQAKVDALPWGSDDAEVKRFQKALVDEQQRRNREANAATERLFGFASGGVEASWANAMISILYDTHLLGDYLPPPDNSDFDGLQNFSSVVGDLINAIRKIDANLPEAKQLVKDIQRIANNTGNSVHIRAQQLIGHLSENLPQVLAKARSDALKRRFHAAGIEFR